MARDMARKVILPAEDGEAIGREGAVAYQRPRFCCALLGIASVSEKTELEWTTKFAFGAPTARQRTILSTASAAGFIGQQHHAAYMASKGGYDFAHQGYGYRLGRYSLRVRSPRQEYGRRCIACFCPR